MKKLLLIILISLSIFSCKEPPTPTPIDIPPVVLQKHELGELWGGGIVIYLSDTSKTHGFVVSNFDIGNQVQWGCSILYPNNKTDINYGKLNTYNIITYCNTPGIAAKLCYDYKVDKFDDWFLPSLDELNLLYLNKKYVTNWSDAYKYWSSSQLNSYSIYVKDWSDGKQYIITPTSKINVRAIRSF